MLPEPLLQREHQALLGRDHDPAGDGDELAAVDGA
jgi:hypothetical protein